MDREGDLVQKHAKLKISIALTIMLVSSYLFAANIDADIDTSQKLTSSHADLLYKKASVYADQGDWKNTLSILDEINKIQPNYAKAIKLRKIIEEKKRAEPHNEFGFNINEAYISDLSSYWNYSNVHYYRLTDHGKFGGHINYARRYGTSGKQFQLEAYPIFSKNMYASLSIGYANTTQILYPNLQYMVEGYVNPPHGWEFSLGQTGQEFIRFSHQKIFNNTGSIGKYIGNSFVWFRPHFFSPQNTKFYELGFRQYFSDSDNYIGIVIAAGQLPDIADLPPLDQIFIVNQKGFGVSGQVALTKTVFLNYGIGYARQIFPTKLRREVTDGSMGIVLKA